MAAISNRVTEFKVDKEHELRFEVENGATVQIELTKGNAEIKGTELVTLQKYTFRSGAKIPLFTYHGCEVTIYGETESAYVSKETPMAFYSNTHLALEQMRKQAESTDGPEQRRGPRVLIAGPNDVGKTTLCRILTNYAVRYGRSPIYVDLDVGQSSISLPGTIGAVAIERPIPVQENFPLTTPIVFHYGDTDPGANIDLYNTMVAKLAYYVHQKTLRSRKAHISGVIINSCGWVRQAGYHALVAAAGAFEIDVILVIDQERLKSELTEAMPDFVKVVLLPKSGGVVERSREQRKSSRTSRISEYFYGCPQSPLKPHAFEIRFSDVELFKLGTLDLPESCLPVGMETTDNRTKIVTVQPSPSLLHRVCSVSAATDSSGILNENVLGFIIITNVNMKQETLTVLSPEPYPLPRSILLVSEMAFMDIK